MDELHITDIYALAGIVGVGFYLGSYFALQMGFLRGRGYAYPALNAVAALLVLVSLFESFNLSSALIQVFWIVISIFGMTRLYLLRNKTRITEEEKEFLELALPDMPVEYQRALLDNTTWRDCKSGETLIHENKPVQHLVFMKNGAANVMLDNKIISTIKKQVLFGEITCLDGKPATASIELTQPSRVMLIDVQKLRVFLEKEPEVLWHIERCFKSSLAKKLHNSSQKVMRLSKALHTANTTAEISAIPTSNN